MSGAIRDKALLDALERRPQRPYAGTAWRSVREGSHPTDCWRSGGRWDDRTFDVLYTSLASEGAIEERRFHLFMGQPIPPSKVRYELFKLEVSLEQVIELPDLEALNSIGLDTQRYGQASYADKHVEYPPSQVIAEACFFLGADGLLVPSARYDCLNLIVFCEQETEMSVSIIQNHGIIDWSR